MSSRCTSPSTPEPVVMTKPELNAWLARRIEQRIPAAVVRYGDGELSSLVARLDDADSIRVAKHKLDGESGLSFTPEDVLDVGRALALSFDRADVLGILYSHRGVLNDGQLEERQMNPLTKLYLERLTAGRAPALLASSHLQHDVMDLLPKALAGRRVSVISCRDVRPVLEGDWGLRDVVIYQVPSQCSARDLDGAYEATMHEVPIWPDRHDELQAELTVRDRGEVFLVGAGVFAKDLCIHIREMGGLALDLGSGLDRIVGKLTRGPLRQVHYLLGQGRSVPEIVEDMERRYGVTLDAMKVQRFAEAPPPHWVAYPHVLDPLL